VTNLADARWSLRKGVELLLTKRAYTETEIDAGVGAAWKVAKVEPGSSVVIFRLGSIGLAVSPAVLSLLFPSFSQTWPFEPVEESNSTVIQVAQGAKMCGASMIIGVDLNPDKEEIGKSYFHCNMFRTV
jgi:S-(hydroxymethyl)glutathione dehydrogenase/alcohol dehydrogenase